MQVAILDDYQNAALEAADWSAIAARAEIVRYRDWTADPQVLVARLRHAEVIVAMRERTAFARDLLVQLPNLKLLVTTGGRNAAIDLDAARELGIRVCATGGLVQPTVELTWGLILAALRGIPREHQATRAGRWQTGIGVGLEGKTLGLLGLGRIGAKVARIGQGFGMDTLAWSQNLTAATAGEHGVRLAASKAELLRQADVVSLHMVLSARSRGLIGAAELATMKTSAWLINTSRGGLIDEQALSQALTTGAIAGAALDVFQQEPLPAGHPFLTLDNLLLSPHMGYVTRENYQVFYGDAVADILAFWAGEPLRVLA